jgi:hypothetical protein
MVGTFFHGVSRDARWQKRKRPEKGATSKGKSTDISNVRNLSNKGRSNLEKV